MATSDENEAQVTPQRVAAKEPTMHDGVEDGALPVSPESSTQEDCGSRGAGEDADNINVGGKLLTQAPEEEDSDGNSREDGSISNNNNLLGIPVSDPLMGQLKTDYPMDDETGDSESLSQPDEYKVCSRLHQLGIVPSFDPVDSFYSSDYSSTGESESDEEEEEGEDDQDNATSSDQKPGIEERRRRNLQRNHARLVSAGLAKKGSTPGRDADNTLQIDPTPQKPPTPRPQHAPLRGMLFATPYNSNQYHTVTKDNPLEDEEDEAMILERMQQAYPYRESQIQQLWSLLSPALPSNTTLSTTTAHVPAPIFVTGPAGTGKSTIVRDLVTCLKRSRSPLKSPARVGSAHVNCALGTTIDELANDAYRQLAHDMKAGRHYASPRRKKRKRKTFKKTPPLVPLIGKDPTTAKRRCLSQGDGTVSRPVELPQTKDSSNETAAECTNESKAAGGGDTVANAGEALPAGQTNSDSVKEVTDSLQTDDNPLQEAVKVLERRRSQRVNKFTAATDPANNDKGKLKKELSDDLLATTNSPTGVVASGAAASQSAHVAAATFGQELKESLFKHKQDAAFLILDNAERLLSLSTTTTSASKINFLAQLLLLAREKGLNLTVIVITKSIILEHSRFNNLVAADKSLTTLLSAIQPVKVHFQAYKGKERFRQILSQRMLLERIIGPNMLRSYTSGNDPFTQRVVNSFLNVLVQSLYGSSRDVKEILRLGRSLWPLYVRPLHSSKVEKTMKSVHKMFPSTKNTAATTEAAGKHVLSFLDQQILPEMRQKLDQCMYTFWEEEQKQSALVEPSASQSQEATATQQIRKVEGLETLPYFTKCLLLAAFICQTNRADKDKQLFTIQKNGKKNNGNKRKSPGEDVAFGGGISRVFRPRLFPMERMLSVFVSIVGLNQDQSAFHKVTPRGIEMDPGSIGSSDLFEALSHLRDIGVLHDKVNMKAPSGQAVVNLAAPRFWCSLTREEANTVGRSVNFQLENYLF